MFSVISLQQVLCLKNEECVKLFTLKLPRAFTDYTVGETVMDSQDKIDLSDS